MFDARSMFDVLRPPTRSRPLGRPHSTLDPFDERRATRRAEDDGEPRDERRGAPRDVL
jgi:hypothetical protein